VHNCETSQGLLDFHLLSLLSQDQILFDPHQRPVREKVQGGKKKLRRVEDGEAACPVQGEAQ